MGGFTSKPNNDKNIQNDIEQRLIRPPIGGGTFGTVFKIQENGKLLACKRIQRTMESPSKKEKSRKDWAESEVDVLMAVEHRNLLHFSRVEHTAEFVYIFTEYCNGGNLRRYIAANHPLPNNIAREFARDLYEGVRCLHKHHIIHRDLKPSNVLLHRSRFDDIVPWTLKIADFGLSRLLAGPDDVSHTYVGTPMYMSYEALNRNQYSFATDMWSFGAVMFRMSYNREPFPAKTRSELLELMENRLCFPTFPRRQIHLKSLIRGLLNISPVHRYMLDDVAVNKWLTETHRAPRDSGNKRKRGSKPKRARRRSCPRKSNSRSMSAGLKEFRRMAKKKRTLSEVTFSGMADAAFEILASADFIAPTVPISEQSCG